jgi:hypothetical protein
MKLNQPIFISISLESWLGIYQPIPSDIEFKTETNNDNITIFFPTYLEKRKMLNHLSQKSPRNITEAESDELSKLYESISKSRQTEL